MKDIHAADIHEALMQANPPDFNALYNQSISGAVYNAAGLLINGYAISWQGMGGINVHYTYEHLQYLRLTIFRSMPVVQYMTDAMLLHHYFTNITPAMLLADAASQAVTLNGNSLHKLNLN